MKTDANPSQQVIDNALKLLAIVVLLAWCFAILRPFIMLIAWGAIIATALYPVALMIAGKTRLSEGKASSLLSLIGVILLLIPLVALSTGIYTSASELFTGLQDGTLVFPKPKPNIQELPVIGDKLYAMMTLAATNLEGAFAKYGDELRQLSSSAASVVGSLAGGLLQFIIATIIAGAFMNHAAACKTGLMRLVDRMTQGAGQSLVELSTATVRGVVQGVIGVAAIQSVLAAIGLVVAGVPAAGIWALGVLLIAIVQLPPILALLPAIIYLFSVGTTTTATLFLVWCILVSGSDAVLKPMLLSRGSHVPTLVILLGALGGMAMSGIIGLFVGSVVLSLGYQLLSSWLSHNSTEESQ
ncbi:AI-2E family transporter [Aliagarivorans taiwanensis]|uniref:AI-2E family transporter n=1 Tax=Aliagarivorans taiwanensis TaxID=561966 RepID=UPI000406622F|nr:AI-2E family transporter [Aliagarivorans taiwanensis]